MKKAFLRILSLILVLAMLVSVSACFESHSIKCYPDEVEKNLPGNTSDEFNSRYLDFSADMLIRTTELTGDDNVVVSPISLLAALAMIANGAEGETLAQFETLFGMSVDELSKNVGAYLNALDGSDQTNAANSIWIKNGFDVEQKFINDCGKYFIPDIYTAPFDDTTLRDINAWADEKTDGLIPKILEEINPSAVMYLINAVLFDAKWETKYQASDAIDHSFTNSKGETSEVEMLRSEESRYFEGDGYTGFAKDYEGRAYSFVALLPEAGMTPEELLLSISENLDTVLSSSRRTNVSAFMPRFKSENTIPLSDILADMGLVDAFVPGVADFSGATKNDSVDLYISNVLQKTYIELDENGTKAAAVTIVEMVPTSASPIERETVVLDRPYVYMIVHNETNLPVFIGITNNAS